MDAQPFESTGIIFPVPELRPSYLMCQPKLYDVTYVINPWMTGNLHASSHVQAIVQWEYLHSTLSTMADIELIAPKHGSPDMVFTANGGLEHLGSVVVSRFLHPERQAEEEYFRRWFYEAGYRVIELPSGMFFEGEGDALFSIDGSRLWAGYGQRTSYSSHQYLAQAWNVEVTSLHLVDPRFYHLDTCFAPLAGDFIMYYPEAFDAVSIARIEAFYPMEKRIAVTEGDAVRFACNAINIDRTVILNAASRELITLLEAQGFKVSVVTLTEFLKSGGAAKCLVMKLGMPVTDN
jgi:ornithine--oxo-acid transaminase